MVSSKIMYKQQFVAVVQKKKQITKANSHKNYARVQETVIATVNIWKKYQKNRCQCHTIRNGPNVKSDRPPSQATSKTNKVQWVTCSSWQIWEYSIRAYSTTWHEFTTKQIRINCQKKRSSIVRWREWRGCHEVRSVSLLIESRVRPMSLTHVERCVWQQNRHLRQYSSSDTL